MLATVLTFAAGAFALAFLVLFLLTILAKDHARRVATLRWASAAAAIAGLLMIAPTLIGSADLSRIACGAMLLIFATGIQIPARKAGTAGR